MELEYKVFRKNIISPNFIELFCIHHCGVSMSSVEEVYYHTTKLLHTKNKIHSLNNAHPSLYACTSTEYIAVSRVATPSLKQVHSHY